MNTPKYLEELRDAAAKRNDKAALRAIESLTDDPPCAFPWEKMLVDVNGNVTTCCLNSHVIGNVKEHPLEEIWNGEKAHELREQFLRHDYRSCSLRCPVILDRVKKAEAQK